MEIITYLFVYEVVMLAFLNFANLFYTEYITINEIQ